MAGKLWTEEEISDLIDVFPNLTETALVERFGRIYSTIKTKYYRLKKDVKDTEEEIARDEATTELYIPETIKKYRNISEQAKDVCRAIAKGYYDKTDSYFLCVNGRYEVIPKGEDNPDFYSNYTKPELFAAYLCASNKLMGLEDTTLILYYIKHMDAAQLVYDPFEPETYKVLHTGTVKFNTFQETEYLKLSRTAVEKHDHLLEEEFEKKFPRTYLLLMNLFEDNYSFVKIFINNIAAIAHRKSKLGTITIMKGLQGAGKNQLGEEFLVPLFGKKQVIISDAKRMDANFNAMLATAFIVIIDETKNEAGEMNALSEKLKSMSTGEDMLIEKKFSDAQQQRTYFNFFLMSNNNKAGHVDLDDRRHYVFGTVDTIENRAQKILKENMETYWAKLRSEETDEFLKYLVTLDYKISLARKASVLNQTKVRMILGTGKRYELFFKIVQTKKIEFFNYLFQEIVEANGERNMHNEKIRKTQTAGQFRTTTSDIFINDFFKQAIKGYIRKDLLVSMFDLFMNDEKNWPIAKLKRIASESLDDVKVNGYFHYKTSPTEIDMTVEEIKKFKLYKEIYEEEEEVLF